MHRQGISLLSLLLGLALPLFLSTTLSIAASIILLLAALFLFFWPFCRFLGMFCLGVIWSQVHLQNLIERQLPADWEGKDIIATLVVTSTPERRGDSQRFFAEIVSSHEEGFQWRDSLRLSWYKAPDLHVGQHWEVQMRLKRPRGFVNGEGFDYQAWLLSNRIFATGYVRRNFNASLLPERSSFFFETLRSQLKTRLFVNEKLAYERFMLALLLGDKSAIRQEDWQHLQTSGTLHLMAISGLHIGLLAGLGFLLGQGLRYIFIAFFGTRHVFFLIPILTSVFFAWVYAGLAGFAIPTQRAFLFVSLMNLAFLLRRKVNLFYLLGLCAVLLAAIDPFVFLAPGFYLSFSAVFILFAAFQGRIHLNKFKNTLYSVFLFFKAQWILFIGLFLPLAMLSLPVSLVGVIANSIAIPVISFIVVPFLFIAASVFSVSSTLALFLLEGADRVLELLWFFLLQLNEFSHASVYPNIEGYFAFFALFIAAALFFLPRYLRWQYLFIPLVFVAFASHKTAEPGLRIKVLDVGQGLAVYIEWDEGNMLYDTGARFSEDFDIGSRVIVPWLRNQGVDHLDFLVISHGDNDHAGGLPTVQEGLEVDRIIYGPNVKLTPGDALATQCESGQLLSKGALSIAVLWPDFHHGQPFDASSNNLSCVVLVRHKEFSLLLSGDIEKEVEYALLANAVLPEKIDALLAPHHGSRSSSTAAFVEQLQPEVVIFSVGYRNRYFHPNRRVLERYQLSGARILRTDLHGALEYRHASGWQAARSISRRAWYDSDRP